MKKLTNNRGEVWCNPGSGRGDLFCSVAHPLPGWLYWTSAVFPPPLCSPPPPPSERGHAQVTKFGNGASAAPRPTRLAAASPPASRAGGSRRGVDEMMVMTMVDDGAPPATSAALAEARRQHEATRGFAARVAAEESDTDADSEAPPLSSGTQGFGEPLMVGAHDKRRRLGAGAGLCSLGQWPPWRRPAATARSWCWLARSSPTTSSASTITSDSPRSSSSFCWRRGRSRTIPSQAMLMACASWLTARCGHWQSLSSFSS